MKFDVVTGNPPYQDNKDGGKDLPLYPFFYELAEKISPSYCLISPARFLSGAGATKSEWNQKMLNDPHLKVVYFNQKSSNVFINTDIKGGVAVIYRNKEKNFGGIKTFTSSNELSAILQKVEDKTDKNIGDILYGVTSYTFSAKAYQDYPYISNRVGKGSGNQLTSGIFDAVPEIFLGEKQSEKQIQILGRQNSNRVYKWVNLDYIQIAPNLNSFRVFVPAASGSGALGETISSPVVGNPNIAHTATFISMGNFKNACEAEALLKYLKTKFSRAMLSVKKTTQHNKTKEVWSKVPLQDFTANSDIDWTKSIFEIDQQLYKKYGLDQTEIDFIESKIKAME